MMLLWKRIGNPSTGIRIMSEALFGKETQMKDNDLITHHVTYNAQSGYASMKSIEALQANSNITDIQIRELSPDEALWARKDHADFLWRCIRDYGTKYSQDEWSPFPPEEWVRTGMTQEEYERKYV
jgi:hypothetical protein